MKPLGLSDLPDNPMLMPGPQLSQKIGLNSGADAPQSAIAASPGTVSEYERKIAVQMQSADQLRLAAGILRR